MLREVIPELNARDARQELHSQKFPHLRRIIFLGAAAQAVCLVGASLLAYSEQVAPDKLVERQARLDFLMRLSTSNTPLARPVFPRRDAHRTIIF